MITVIYFGRRKEQFWRAADDEYVKRISGFSGIRLIELPQAKLPENPSQSLITAALAREAELLRGAVAKNARDARLVALCLDGKSYDSVQFAGLLEGNVCFVVGSSHGLADSAVAAADTRLTLSGLTLPHELARVVLLEQIYRGFTIRSGGKYHK